ncbi:serine hydrolase [Variovorax paradoxus]|uniref:serine hydrolase domain-containing protein n=1 Tax=Variovorax paradoxus TaxID=34073 RepID=UPI001ABC6C75
MLTSTSTSTFALHSLTVALFLAFGAGAQAQPAAAPADASPEEQNVGPLQSRPASLDTTPTSIMQGFPPPADKRVTRANWLSPPYLRWSLRNAREVGPTAGVSSAETAAALPTAGEELPLEGMTLELPGGRTATFEQYLAGNVVDGLIVLHRGRVVYERYLGGMKKRDMHGWASMAKSVVGLLAAQLIHEGRLDPNAPLSRYVPELGENPLGKATVQQNLNMEVALAYPPQLPPDIGLFTAAGLLPAREGMPGTIYDFLKIAPRPVEAPHGSVFYYQNSATEAVAWALRRVTGRSLAQLASERIWQPMGAQDDAYYTLDSLGTEFAAGGLSSTLRDAARFGELVRNEGRAGSRQVVPSLVVARILATPSAANQERLARAGRTATGYGDYWWHAMDTEGAVYALGRFGQRLYVDRANQITIAQFGAYADTRARSTQVDQAVAPQADELQTSAGLVALARAISSRITRASAGGAQDHVSSRH